ncbi:lipopolysaccharide biosynthesis protein [Ilyomonas limi]|uniref:Lipopolysaccharide biosynthesis protein n=1 Tax=Ilyomonas limi TaxID=2575867 RepID=A0A4U3KYC1_9BACT|nr:lipopolysaccharide biosynthesis protein [Ilyomonas limi]TKK66156.1 lipopolysaccharide biosynthesis protein [Ilyomonas limi]
MVNKQQIVKSGIWQMMNTGVIFISQLGYYAILARMLPHAQKEFGVFALLNSCMVFGNVVAEAGMGDALLQRKHVEPQHKNAALYYSLATGVFFYLILYIAAPWLADFYQQPILSLGLRVIGISFILYSLGSPSINLLQKEFQFKKIFFSDSLSLLASNVFGIVLAYYGFGVMALVYSTLFYNISKVIMLWIQEPLPVKIGSTWRHYKDLLNYGLLLTVIRITNYINLSGINFMLGKIITIQEVGIFDRANRISNIPGRYIGDIVQKISMPTMVKVDGDDKLFNVYYKSLSFLHSLLVPVSVFFGVFSMPCVLILLGDQFISANMSLKLMLFALPFQISTRLSDGVMRVKGLLVLNLKRKILSTIILVVCMYFGSYWHITGISAGFLIATVINYYIMIVTLRGGVFPDSWQQLLFKPFINGIPLTIYTVVPSVILYEVLRIGLHLNEVESFLVMGTLVGLFLAYAFFKKPKLLGKDFLPIREILLNKNKNKKGHRKQLAQDEEAAIVEQKGEKPAVKIDL